MSQLEELKQIIVGDNADQIDQLKQRIENVEQRTADVAEVLSPAISKEVKESGGEMLAASLEKPVSLGLKRAIRSEPQEYAEILYPVMAPSIRRAIAQAISSMMLTINRTVESATSVKGLSLRYQSMKTGIPYAELALRKSLLYRVEHLYLIHRDTGMALVDLHAEDTEMLDSDAVGAMFSAIQSFVQDSFTQNDSDRLSEAKVGEHNLWLANGPSLMLACVIRGDAPQSLRGDLNDVLDAIRTEYANDIADFEGDVTPFATADILMQPVLVSEIRESEKEEKEEKAVSIGSAMIALLLLGLVGFFLVNWLVGRSQLDTVEHFLRDTPGVATTDLYWKGGKLVVEGLKDPDAVIPFDTFRAYGISPETLQINMIPFRSLEVDMERLRFESELDLPSGVGLAVENGIVSLRGQAPIRWLNGKNVRLRQLSADRRLSITNLSASHDSVLAMLAASFPQADLLAVDLLTVRDPVKTTVQIGGRIPARNLALLQAIFASNDWVDVTAQPY